MVFLMHIMFDVWGLMILRRFKKASFLTKEKCRSAEAISVAMRHLSVLGVNSNWNHKSFKGIQQMLKIK